MNVSKHLTTHLHRAAQVALGNIDDFEQLRSVFEVIPSDRPDLADYQCNAAMTLAKRLHKNPREIAQAIQTALQRELGSTAHVHIAGAGFINIRLSDEYLLSVADSNLTDVHHGFEFTNNPKQVMIDFGSPNIAKELHVGHLRPHLIGDSLQRLMRFYGDAVTSDIHMGDWGTPIGMIIAQLQYEQPYLEYFNSSISFETAWTMSVEELGNLYRRSKQHWDDSTQFQAKARQATEALQSGRLPGYRALWRRLRDISLDDVRGLYRKLDINFDLWLGESDVNDLLPTMIDELKQRGIARMSEGAIIIPADILGLPDAPPLILMKGDGAYTYAATDLATIKDRIITRKADAIIYVVDNRQKQHFEQVFAAARLAGYAGSHVALIHVGHGTINDKTGHPFKTRDGQTVRLKDILDIAYKKAREHLPDPGQHGITEMEIDNLSNQIGIAAIKFQEFTNKRNSDYIFDIDNFTSFEGKTGPYLQYAVARCRAILEKARDYILETGKLKITSRYERNLLLHIMRFPEAIEFARLRQEPSAVANHAYRLAQLFSTFYAQASVLMETDSSLQSSRIRLVDAVQQQMLLCFSLLGIEAPTRMLKKESGIRCGGPTIEMTL
jgi:arginyl-tRNA synthetase